MNIVKCKGFQLDEYHIISYLIDKEKNKYYGLFTFTEPIINNKVEIKDKKEIYILEIIDPNNFEWNGKKVKIVEFDNLYDIDDIEIISYNIEKEGFFNARNK